MPRVPYKPADIAEPQVLVQSIRARRGGQLLHLDRMLLHSPAFAEGWNAFLRQVRTALELSPRLRELAICTVAVLNRAEYEFHHHSPELLKAGGSPEQVTALRDPESARRDTRLFDDAERAVLAFTIEMTRDVHVRRDTFDAAQAALPNDQQLVELTGVIAAYNMVSRFLAVLEIEPEH